jgi:hypothetical protein
MDIITAEFNNIMSGRIPKFKKTTAEWPKMELQIYNWKIPHKEGGNDQPDEITLRVSTILYGITYYEKYTIVTGINDVPPDVISVHLQRILTDSVKLGLANAVKE